MVPQVKPGPDGGVLRRASCKSTHDLQSPPNKREKNCTHGAQARPEQRHSCHLVCDSSDGLLLGGWERYTEVTKRGGQHTLPALSRATASTDPNYIILAPLNPGSQLLRPVYQEDTIPEGESVLGCCEMASQLGGWALHPTQSWEAFPAASRSPHMWTQTLLLGPFLPH